MAAFGGVADIYELHAIGFGGELFPVGLGLRVADHLEIVGDVESELFFGSGELRRGLRGHCGGGKDCREKHYEHKVVQLNCSHGAVFYSLAVELSKGNAASHVPTRRSWSG